MKDVGLLWQLYRDGQINLRPEFQRDSVWPKSAKAYLIDTILNDRPIPIFFMQRGLSPQTGRPTYEVIDGQQRLRAMFEFLNNDLGLTQSKGDSAVKEYAGRKYADLPDDLRHKILNYPLIVEELNDYSESDVRDMFARINRFVVKLSPQELRHAKQQGRFAQFVERLGKWRFWEANRVF